MQPVATRVATQLFVITLCVGVNSVPLQEASPIDASRVVRALNADLLAANVTWVAGENLLFSGSNYGLVLARARRLMGAKYLSPHTGTLPERPWAGEVGEIPDTWNSITEFAHCPSVADVWDQGACASCYVLATVMSAADRMCVASKGNLTARLSAEHMLGCCKSCGNGCAGGFPPYAWDWMASHGVVSGGAYGDSTYCLSYDVKGCEHYQPKTKGPSCAHPAVSPACPLKCDKNSTWPTPMAHDLVKFKSSYQVPSDDRSIQVEIMTHASVTAEMNVYSDFLHYKSGVYQALGGEDLGGHAVRIIGWGTEAGKPYWRVANSWNRDWGDGGYFKILRGNCGINLGVYAGLYL